MKSEVILVAFLVCVYHVTCAPVPSNADTPATSLQGVQETAEGHLSFPMVFTLELPPYLELCNKKYKLSIKIPSSGLSISK
ncbi:hypothetical protein SNE40_007634 [Patella caerulea]|uniref:Uncharacterized protein n=1 Tax=Patella caerulea TaxID=87958 RepID=A0AAN8K3Z0_PATCE